MNRQKKKFLIKEKINTITVIAIVGAVLCLIGYAVILSMIPVNVGYPVFEAPSNIFIKTIQLPDGSHIFASQSTKGGKIVNKGHQNPSLYVDEGSLVVIHLINEVKIVPNISNKHNLNIDEFNVHTGDIGYFQTKSVTFLANKKGSFEYYDSYNPQMRGLIYVR